MGSKSLLLAAIGAGVIGAAAAGGYVAMRMNAAEQAAAVTTEPPPAVETAARTGTRPASDAPAVADPDVPASPAAPKATPADPQARDNRTSSRLEAPSGTSDPAPPAVSSRTVSPSTQAPAVERDSRPANPPAGRSVGSTRTRPTESAPAPNEGPTVVAAPAQLPPPPPAPVEPPDADPLPPVGTPVIDVAAEPPPAPRFQEVTLAEDSVIGIRLDTDVSTSQSRVEDRVRARVSRDVTVDGRIAVPAGSRLEGTVMLVDEGGKFRTPARIGIRFETLILADGTRVPIHTDPIFRQAESPTGEATSKLGASAVVGAILGAVIGGKRGAAIGGIAGAAGGTAAVMATSHNEAGIPAGTALTLRLTRPVTVVIDRDQENLQF